VRDFGTNDADEKRRIRRASPDEKPGRSID
jgi:hypothetical protein